MILAERGWKQIKSADTVHDPLSGFEYSDDDDVDTIELRTTAISTAAACDDEA